jgi:polysaccharide biosynthesis transport protein
MLDSPLAAESRRYLGMVLQRRPIVATCVGVSLLLAVLYNSTTRPLYEASCRLLIERSTPKVLPNKELIDPGIQDYQTEYELLRSRALAEQVVKELHLQDHLGQLLAARPTLSERARALFDLDPAPPSVAAANLAPAVAALQSRVRVEPLPGGRLVDVRFTAYDPALAARVANGVADFYIEQMLGLRSDRSSAATDWLAAQVQDQKKKLEAAEVALLEYQQANGLIGTGSGQSEETAGLEAAVTATRTERIGKESLLRQMRGLPAAQLAGVPALAANASVAEARTRLSTQQAELARLAESLGEKHPDMVRARRDVRAAQESLQAEVQNALRSLEADCRAARDKEASLQASLDSTRRQGLAASRSAIDSTSLQREVETSRQLYESLVSRRKETGLESEMRSTGVRVVDRAVAPGRPSSPRKLRNLGLALLLGLLLGVALAVLFEHLDNTIKTPDDAKRLGLGFLGLVPTQPDPQRDPLPAGAPTGLTPEAGLAEAYRVLRTNLLSSVRADRPRVVLVTSASPGEGKTTTAANMAVALALTGSKVALVDADLRQSRLHAPFHARRQPGLSDLIAGRVKASDALQATRYANLQLLAAGSRAANPAELLGSTRMREVLDALRTLYQWVVVDTPPVLAMADTPVLCPLADAVVLVVASEESQWPIVRRAVEQITSVGGRLAGTVLNRVDLERNTYYYGQYYGTYARSYYASAPPVERRHEA